MGPILKLEAVLDAGVGLLGAIPPSPRPTTLGAVLLGIMLVVAAVVGWWNWREAHEEEAVDTPEDLLASFEQAHAAGELDDDEIKRLRAKLIGDPPPSSAKARRGGGPPGTGTA
jgi:hypothetical protein